MPKENFTASRIKAFKCPEGKVQDFLWDSATPGLGLRATSNGAKAYIFQARIEGKTYRPTIGSPNTWTIPAAQAEARRLKVMIDRGEDPRGVQAAAAIQREHTLKLEAIATAKSSLIARSVWDEYISARESRWGTIHKADHLNAANQGGEDCKIGNKQAKRGPLASLLEKPLYEITGDVVQNWLATECKTRPTFAHNSYRKFRTFINWCAEHRRYADVVHVDCCKTTAVKEILPKNKTKEGDSLEKGQLKAWFGEVKKLSNPAISIYLQGLLITGARRNELIALRWEDVVFGASASLTMRDKVDGTRTIPLTPHLEALLTSLPRDNQWVFSSQTSASGHLEAPTKAHARALKSAALPHVSLHGLRRSFSTLAEWLDAPAGVIAQIMGHKPSAIAEKHYRRRPLDMLREWHVKIEIWMLERANEATPP